MMFPAPVISIEVFLVCRWRRISQVIMRNSLQGGFLCLERKGVENYPSQDKAVVFVEVADLRSFVASVGSERFVRVEFGGTPPWAVLHDPESHNVVCIEAAGENREESE